MREVQEPAWGVIVRGETEGVVGTMFSSRWWSRTAIMLVGGRVENGGVGALWSTSVSVIWVGERVVCVGTRASFLSSWS